MVFRIPTADDLRRLAAANYFELSDQELSDFQALMPDKFAFYDLLERMTLPHEPTRYRATRDLGHRHRRTHSTPSCAGAACGVLLPGNSQARGLA